jgi:hypothetical protein
MGRETVASFIHSTAMGYKTEASGDYSTAMGVNTKATGLHSTAMGKFNNPGPDKNPHILSVGGGSSDTERSNSLAINYDNKVIIGEAKMPLGSEVRSDMTNLLEILANMGIITIKEV